MIFSYLLFCLLVFWFVFINICAFVFVIVVFLFLVVFISFLDYNEVVICMVDFIDMFFSHFFSEAKRNARKESAWYVEVIPLTKWLKKAPPSLKRPNSQVCRDFFTCGEGVGFLLPY